MKQKQGFAKGKKELGSVDHFSSTIIMNNQKILSWCGEMSDKIQNTIQKIQTGKLPE